MMMSNVVDRQKQFENAMCGRGFFHKQGEKKTFSKVSGYMWTCKNDLKVLCVDTDFIKNRRKKVPFSRLVNERCAISKLTSRWSA